MPNDTLNDVMRHAQHEWDNVISRWIQRLSRGRSSLVSSQQLAMLMREHAGHVIAETDAVLRHGRDTGASFRSTEATVEIAANLARAGAHPAEPARAAQLLLDEAATMLLADLRDRRGPMDAGVAFCTTLQHVICHRLVLASRVTHTVALDRVHLSNHAQWAHVLHELAQAADPQLARAVRIAADTRAPQDLASRPARAQSSRPAPTSRERQVLQLLAEGMSDRRIGRTLDITEGTVRSHLRTLYRKLGAHSRVEAIRIARSHGLIRNGHASADEGGGA